MTTERQHLVAAIQEALAESAGQSTIFSNAVAERVGASSTELETVSLLYARGPQPAGELSRRTGLTTGAVTRLVDRLIAMDWARRLEDPEDRRRVLVELTPAARKAWTTYYAPLDRAASAMLATYTDKELELILDFARRMQQLTAGQTERVQAQPQLTMKRKRGIELKTKVLGQKVRVRLR